MATQITVETNASLLAMALGDFTGKQVPFATARALTDVAFQAQRASKSELATAFELRNRFSAGGIQVNPAEKADWPNTQAEVGIEERRSYLIDHVTGGKRDGGSHGRAILEQESLRGSSGRVPVGKRPAALIARAQRAKAAKRRAGKDKNLPFLFYSAKWGNEVLAQRLGPERYPLQIIYAFKRGVTIKREFEMDLVAQRTVGASYHAAFDKALRRAIATGKDKAERMGSRSRGQGIDRGK